MSPNNRNAIHYLTPSPGTIRVQTVPNDQIIIRGERHRKGKRKATKEKILGGANDNGFGVYSIDGLEVYVHEMYENGYVGDYVGFVKFEGDECVMSDVPEITVDVKKEVIK